MPTVFVLEKKVSLLFNLLAMKGPLFYSKILLFGEYGIIKDSKGLSIPYNFYNGALKIDEQLNETKQKSNQSLKAFATYLSQLSANEPGLVQFDMEALNRDIEAGMYFDSSIPQRSEERRVGKECRAR